MCYNAEITNLTAPKGSMQVSDTFVMLPPSLPLCRTMSYLKREEVFAMVVFNGLSDSVSFPTYTLEWATLWHACTKEPLTYPLLAQRLGCLGMLDNGRPVSNTHSPHTVAPFPNIGEKILLGPLGIRWEPKSEGPSSRFSVVLWLPLIVTTSRFTTTFSLGQVYGRASPTLST